MLRFEEPIRFPASYLVYDACRSNRVFHKFGIETETSVISQSIGRHLMQRQALQDVRQGAARVAMRKVFAALRHCFGTTL